MEELLPGCIRSQHHFGRVMPITVVLTTLAAAENAEGDPFDTMVAAAAYIRSLEIEIEQLRAELSSREED